MSAARAMLEAAPGPLPVAQAIVPALRRADGTVIAGKKGEIHQDIYNAQGEVAGHELRLEEPEHGFLNDGTFLTKEQLGQLLGQKSAVDAQALRQLQSPGQFAGEAVDSKRVISQALAQVGRVDSEGELREPTPYRHIPAGTTFLDDTGNLWVRQTGDRCRNPEAGPSSLPADEMMFPATWNRRQIRRWRGGVEAGRGVQEAEVLAQRCLEGDSLRGFLKHDADSRWSWERLRDELRKLGYAENGGNYVMFVTSRTAGVIQVYPSVGGKAAAILRQHGIVLTVPYPKLIQHLKSHGLVGPNLTESGDTLKNFFKQLNATSTEEISFGFAIHTTNEDTIRAQAEDRALELTDAVWEQLNNDVGQLERNALKVLKNCGITTRDEGHGFDGDLVGTAWAGAEGKRNLNQWIETDGEAFTTTTGKLADVYKGAAVDLWQGVSEMGEQLLDVHIDFFDYAGKPGVQEGVQEGVNAKRIIQQAIRGDFRTVPVTDYATKGVRIVDEASASEITVLFGTHHPLIKLLTYGPGVTEDRRREALGLTLLDRAVAQIEAKLGNTTMVIGVGTFYRPASGTPEQLSDGAPGTLAELIYDCRRLHVTGASGLVRYARTARIGERLPEAFNSKRVLQQVTNEAWNLERLVAELAPLGYQAMGYPFPAGAACVRGGKSWWVAISGDPTYAELKVYQSTGVGWRELGAEAAVIPWADLISYLKQHGMVKKSALGEADSLKNFFKVLKDEAWDWERLQRELSPLGYQAAPFFQSMSLVQRGITYRVRASAKHSGMAEVVPLQKRLIFGERLWSAVGDFTQVRYSELVAHLRARGLVGPVMEAETLKGFLAHAKKKARTGAWTHWRIN